MGRWKPYAKNLKPLLNVLNKLPRLFGGDLFDGATSTIGTKCLLTRPYKYFSAKLKSTTADLLLLTAKYLFVAPE